MKRKLFGITVLVVLAISLLGTPSCARSQKLVSVTLQPSGGFVFEGFDAKGQFVALGTYIHPPETKDISSKVDWKIDIGNFGTIDSTGLITYTRTDGCGSGNVTATFTSGDSVMIGSAPVKGVNDATAACR